MINNLIKQIIRLNGINYIDDIDIKYLSEIKLLNMIKALNEEKQGVTTLESYPFEYIIEPTNHCNLACALCPTGLDELSDSKKGVMSFDLYKNIIDVIFPYCCRLYLQNWGEPTLVKQLPQMIEYASKKGIWVVLSTNFSIEYENNFLLDLMQSGLGLLKIDLDGVSQNVYEIFRRNGDLETVLNNIRHIVKIKREFLLKYPIIEAVFLVNRHNEHQIKDFIELCENLGVCRSNISKLQINPATGASWLPIKEEHKYANYEQTDILPQSHSCKRLYTTMVVNWSGTVDPCCLVYDCRASFGDWSGDLNSLWNNNYFTSARSLFNGKYNVNKNIICKYCMNNLGNNKNLKRFKQSFAICL